MRGRFQDQGGLFSYIRPEERIPADHPLREIRKFVREVLKELSHSFGKLYSQEGRPSIPPEQLLSALLLQVFYGLRSERQLMEQLNYNLLFRWFVGLSPDDPVWDATTFTKNRDRLQRGDVFPEVHGKAFESPKGQLFAARTDLYRSKGHSVLRRYLPGVKLIFHNSASVPIQSRTKFYPEPQFGRGDALIVPVIIRGEKS
jgi:transposase